eukprot:scaffold869_cov150-Cylindrotheca_fusiformis.AAC.5
MEQQQLLLLLRMRNKRKYKTIPLRIQTMFFHSGYDRDATEEDSTLEDEEIVAHGSSQQLPQKSSLA